MTRHRAVTVVAGGAALAVVATAAPAAAHGIGGRSDLPLPVWLVTYGAAAALLASFAALAVLWPRARLENGVTEMVLPPAAQAAARVAAVGVRLLGLALFALVVSAAAFGDSEPALNFAPSAVYVVFWVGLTVVSGLVGDLWSVLSPYDTLARIAARLRPGPRRGAEPATGPGYHWGRWPAVVGLAAFAWLELCHPDPSSPRVVAVALVVYSVAVLAGAARWGRGWLRRGEAFAAFFGLLSAMAPLHVGDDRKLRLRPPLAGLAQVHPDPGTTALVLVALGSTTFDGVTRTSVWRDVVGLRQGWSASVVTTAGLVFVAGLVALLYVAAMRSAARVVGRPDMSLVDTFAPSLVPIALAYAVAHYFSLLVFEGQGAWSQLSDPFGRGWDLFGSADRPIDYLVVSTTTIALVQAGSIVIGHLAGVVLAHDRAVARFKPKLATPSQYPLLAVMVAYTAGGLVLLLQG
ncbi:MAG: hypothetical protein ACRD1K_19530 [Acidimicrobiales bacterium]